MLANRVRETTTTTGTGNITTAGAETGFRTFNTAFGTVRRFYYFVEDANGTAWESGIGYLSASTTLVREKVLDNSSGGTTAITLTSGTHNIYCSVSNGAMASFPSKLHGAYSGSAEIFYSRHIVGYATSYTERSTRLIITAFVNSMRSPFTKWAIYVKGASSGAVVRMGIYLVDEVNGGPLLTTPWMESDDLDCSSTGLSTSAFTNNTAGPTDAAIQLPPYFYLALAMEDATLQLTAANYTQVTRTWNSTNSNSAEGYTGHNFTLGTPTPGSPELPTLSSFYFSGESYPIGGFQ